MMTGKDSRSRRGDSREEIARQALMALPDDHRRPISMALYGGASYRQVASGLGIAETEARERMRSGLQQVHRDLNSSDGVVIRISSPAAQAGEQPWSPLPAA